MLRGSSQRRRRGAVCRLGVMVWGAMVLGVMVLLGGRAAEGSSPRWVTGPPYFTVTQTPVIWYTDTPLYYTDPGDLSAYVNHAAADAMVAAAAGVWNLPVSRIVLRQGGTLDEQVSGANVYPSGSGLVFPADVESTNYAAKQIAVVYDRDGSVTDLLLGGGASDPLECRQNGVTESVDSITPAGTIEHAVLILNGRCTGPAPEQQLQMQYQLERAFGRVLGVGWSQLNDNVFTGTPQPTYVQALHWPIMHPIDIICGLYTYQCLPQPFTLRDDDIASMVLLYPVGNSGVPAGKQWSLSRAIELEGDLLFSSGPGMTGVNVVIRRNMVPQQVLDPYDDVAAVSGTFTAQVNGNPISPKTTDMAGSHGDHAIIRNKQYGFLHGVTGYFTLPYIPVPAGQDGQDMLMHSEAINPLYTGTYAVGPYPGSQVTPSGDVLSWRVNGIPPGYYGYYEQQVTNTATNCSTAADGTEAAPGPVAASGWWTDLLCGANPYPSYLGHTAWVAIPVQANRSLTMEVTALDEAGYATVNKARPVLGVWNGTDATGTPPSVGAAAAAFNSVALGMTTLSVQSAAAETFRVAISEERGDGRPDYNYRARVLYADAIAPAISGAGAQVTITGMGFRPGNTVTVNGIAAKVTSWTSTSIVATVPLLKSVAPGTTVPVDVVVTDLSTQGTTTMTGALDYVYTAPAYSLALVSGPSGNQPVSLAATPVFTVKALDVDAVTALAGAAVVFSATAGAVQWDVCGAATCTVVTDANGLASATATPLAAGATTLLAAAFGKTEQVSFQAVPLVRSIAATPTLEYLAVGSTVSWDVGASVLQQGQPTAMAPIAWSVTSGPMTISGAQTVTGVSGSAQATVSAGPLPAGGQAVGTVCGWGTVCTSFAAEGVDPAEFVVVPAGGAGQTVPATGTLLPMTFQITDQAGDPVAGAAVMIHQTVSQWTASCAPAGRCPVAPVYQASSVPAVSDSSGMVVVTPLQLAGPEVTDVVVTSGTAGFVSFTMQKVP